MPDGMVYVHSHSLYAGLGIPGSESVNDCLMGVSRIRYYVRVLQDYKHGVHPVKIDHIVQGKNKFISENVHNESVKCYRNIQVILEEIQKK